MMTNEAFFTDEESNRRYYYVSGQAVELWENPETPFGWSSEHMEEYAGGGDWELLFNALVIASLLETGAEG